MHYREGPEIPLWQSEWQNLISKYANPTSTFSIKTFDFSTLYTSIPHSKLKDKLKELVLLCFIKKNGQRRYKYLVLRRDQSYFVKDHSYSNKKILWNWHYQDAWFLDWQHICYVRRTCFSADCRHSHGNQLCPPLADLFLYYYEADFIQELLRKKDKKLAISFNFTFGYINDANSLLTESVTSN